MSATWAQLRLLYLQRCGDTAAAKAEAYTHLSNGLRDIATDPRVNVPELMATDTSVTVTAATDSVAVSTVDFSVFAIANIFNVTDGYPIYPEPGGMLGRDRYLQVDTGKPPDGPITHYMRDGTSLYVRNTPTETTTLRIRVMRQIVDVTEADLNSRPLTPEQYDMAIVQAAAASYYSIHPTVIQDAGGRVQTAPDQQLCRNEVERILTQRRQPMAEEDRPRIEVMRLSGYSPMPRSRRWR